MTYLDANGGPGASGGGLGRRRARHRYGRRRRDDARPRTSRSAKRSTAGVRYSLLRIEAEDLSPVKARILLMLALTQTRDGAAIQRMFQQY